MDSVKKLAFASDYMKGAHPRLLQRLVETNLQQTGGYGQDPACESAAAKIKEACGCPEGKVVFLMGGTQTNAVMIDAFLSSWQGVIAAQTGHISMHEAGAIESAGHKVITLPQEQGKLSAADTALYMEKFYADETWPHMVCPGMVYLSQPTEYGTLYTRKELQEFREVCDRFGLALYVDGARLAYALASPENNVLLPDLAACCDAFYIGGTKCGALFGEAVVIPDGTRLPHLFTIMKQHGAVLAKGRLLGLQFDELFTDHLYEQIGAAAIREAVRIQDAAEKKGRKLLFRSPTNQVFCVMENDELQEFGGKVSYSFWEPYDEKHTVIRLATDWGTLPEETDALIDLL